MKEYVYTCLLRDDPQVIAEYDRQHAAVWPEVLSSLRRIGITGGRIYRLGPRLMMILETTDAYDPVTDGQQHWNSSPRMREWEELMKSYQLRPPEAPHGSGTWTPMTQVWRM
jgi:L-rhamnose mutarotase